MLMYLIKLPVEEHSAPHQVDEGAHRQAQREVRRLPAPA